MKMIFTIVLVVGISGTQCLGGILAQNPTVEGLSDEVYEKIQVLCKKGDDYAEKDEFVKAEAAYRAALELLPENRQDFAAATWIYVAIGDLHFRLNNVDKCFEYFAKAVHSYNGLGNPYIHLRLGQMFFEKKHFPKAADELTRAYMGAGPEIFQEEDPKYFAFLKTKIIIDEK